jgi:sugar phosphate permease
MDTLAPAPLPGGKFPPGLRLFEPAPPAPVGVTGLDAIQRAYRSWRFRVLFASIIGYATFYLVRKNLPIAMPLMQADLHISKSDLGLFLTLHGVLYGVSKFANGFLGDRCNARALMVVGLAASAVMNLFFGFASAVATLGIVWMLNGWFQGMGFPPCARLLTHWFTPKQLPIKMSIWNTSHCIGAVVILLLGGYLAPKNWRLCFFVPAGISFAMVIFLWFTLPDTPPSVGLPEVEGTQTSAPQEGARGEFKQQLLEHVFRNRYIWLIAIANFFVYTLRYAVFDWGPTVLKEAKHIEIQHAAWMLAGFEVFGAIGALLGGWLTNRFFGGRPMRACVFFMVLAGVSILLFWKTAGESKALNTILLCSSGFFIYGPQCLVGIAAANLATKRAAATAVGLTGLFGYLSTVLSGWGLGTLVQHHGWDAGFAALLVIGAVGTLVFAAAWNAKAHGYDT